MDVFSRLPRTAACLLTALLILSGLTSGCAPKVKTAAWVIRYDIDTPEEIEAVCQSARQARFDELLVQVRGRADAFYQSSLAPRPETLREAPEEFDPLGEVLSGCGNIPVHAWLNVYYLWGDTTPPENAEHPGHPGQPWILTDNEGRPVSGYSEFEKRRGWIEGTYADPASAEYRHLFAAVVRELLREYPIAGIHLDFLRYPGPGYGKSEEQARRFAGQWSIDPRLLPEKLDRATLVKLLTGGLSRADRLLTTAALFWSELRAEQITLLLHEIRKTVAICPVKAIPLSAAVYPDTADAYLNKGQDWQTWVRDGLVDSLYPMTYFGEATRVGSQLAELTAHIEPENPVSLWAGLGAYIKDAQQTRQETVLARRRGYNGIALFSLGHLIRQKTDINSYLAAATSPSLLLNPPRRPAVSPRPNPAVPLTGQEKLRAILIKAFGGSLPPSSDLDEKIASLYQELEQAATGSFPQALSLLQERPVQEPEQVGLHGIFRYIHRFDSEDRREEQLHSCREARLRLEEGEDFGRLAAELSQGGTRNMGGGLGKRFLDPMAQEDRELANLQEKEISPVISVANGCWVFQIDEKSKGATVPFADAPWPARRILFRQALSQVTSDE